MPMIIDFFSYGNEALQKARSKYWKQSEDDQITRKKNKVNPFDILSDDILSEILKKLPNDFLRYKAKHVCKRWCNVVTNNLLLDHASFIIQEFGKPTVRHVDVSEEEKAQGIKLKQQNLDLPKKGWVMSWCNEFLLITNREKKEYIYNLITKEGSYIPSCKSCKGRYTYECGVSLSFDGFTGVYKVLHMCMGPPMQCHILTLKKNILSRFSSNWKRIEIIPNEGWGSWGYPVSVQARYIHWDFHGDGRYLVSIDIVKEKMLRMSLPIPNSSFRYTVYEMGGFLALIHQVSFEKTEMWVLKDFEKMKWEKLELNVPNCFFGQYDDFLITPMCSVRSKRYMMCIKTAIWNCGVCSYDMKHGVVEKLNVDFGHNDRCVVYSSSPSFM